MKKEQLIALQFSQPTICRVSELTDQTDRTLLYGYTLERYTWHVYLKDGAIHVYVYRNSFKGDEVLRYEVCGPEVHLNSVNLIPSKRLYPECCDYEFCQILVDKDVHLPFTSWSDREPKKFYGLVK